MPDLNRATWRKSMRSGNGGNCVEVADNFAGECGVVLVRDSKNPTGPVLNLTNSQWLAFLGGVKAGEFTH